MRNAGCKMSEILDDVEMYRLSGFDLTRPENSIQEYDTQSIPKYLSSNQYLAGYDYDRELIFYPQLHGMCHRHKSNCNCLTEGNPQMVKMIRDYIERTFLPNKHPILNFINEYNFIEIYLDNLRLKDSLPEKIFSCRNLKVLSLKGNNLEKISVKIGGLKKLETLYLNDNNLTDGSLPYTLIFCQRLRNLYLDNNRILRLPGFLLKMKYLWLLRRDGINVTSHITMNLVRKTNCAEKIHPIIEEPGSKFHSDRVSSLKKLASHVIIANKTDPFLLTKCQRDIVLQYYWDCSICDQCNTTQFQGSGYLLNTYLYGYLGDYLSLFANKTCSRICAENLSQSFIVDNRLIVLQRLTNDMINNYCSKLKALNSLPLVNGRIKSGRGKFSIREHCIVM